MSAQHERRSLSVVVPVYNSDEALPKLISRLEPILGGNSDEYEVILVDDCSRTDVWSIIETLAAQYPWVRGIRLMRNYGQHNALLCGIREARYEITITLDDDLQNPPEEIPKLLDGLNAGVDVVYGTPLKEQHGLWRDMASRITKVALSGGMGAETARKVSAFRAFRTGVRSAFSKYPGPFVSIDVLLTWGTNRFIAVPVRHDVRQDGESNYTMRRLVVHALNMMTGFSVVPLQIASLVGFAFTLLGIMILVFVLGRYLLEGTSVPGFPFLASIVAIFSGAQLFALGIIGEYLARMHFRSMEQPAYTIRSTAPPSPQNRKAGD
ncbi:MAG: glycosyltransferase family 2 protein [Myxococcota bacterium]|jgi:undecaprenyl-phosphate 4-deoxy-4-formamido-L-arabinose transferase|nr:glycosyltransferase family 2 protein [Myxococcota bacterium]